MQDSLLLVIQDNNLRKLYHGLLLKEGFEVVPMATIEDALVVQVLSGLQFIIVYPDDIEMEEVKAYIHLQETVSRFQRAHLVLLSSQGEDYVEKNHTRVTLINIAALNPLEIVHAIGILHEKKEN